MGPETRTNDSFPEHIFHGLLRFFRPTQWIGGVIIFMTWVHFITGILMSRQESFNRDELPQRRKLRVWLQVADQTFTMSSWRNAIVFVGLTRSKTWRSETLSPSPCASSP